MHTRDITHSKSKHPHHPHQTPVAGQMAAPPAFPLKRPRAGCYHWFHSQAYPTVQLTSGRFQSALLATLKHGKTLLSAFPWHLG